MKLKTMLERVESDNLKDVWGEVLESKKKEAVMRPRDFEGMGISYTRKKKNA